MRAMTIVSLPMAGCEGVTIYPFGEPTKQDIENGIQKPHLHLHKYPDKTAEFQWDGSFTFGYTPKAEDLLRFAEAMKALVEESKTPPRLLKKFAHMHYSEDVLKNCILV